MTLLRTLIATALLAAASLSQALEVKPYSDAAFADAQKANKPVAVHFHADWCPTCKQQAKALQTLSAEPGLDITVLVADYDKEKDLKKRLKVRSQSVMVVFHGEQERARLAGDTEADKFRTALKAGL